MDPRNSKALNVPYEAGQDVVDGHGLKILHSSAFSDLEHVEQDGGSVGHCVVVNPPAASLMGDFPRVIPLRTTVAHLTMSHQVLVLQSQPVLNNNWYVMMAVDYELGHCVASQNDQQFLSTIHLNVDP